jgi:hypothetical protein
VLPNPKFGALPLVEALDPKVNAPPLGAAPPLAAGAAGFAPNEKLVGDGVEPKVKPPPEAACDGE